VSLTLGSTSVVSLANCKILSNRSSQDFRYLPARDEGDRTMKHSSMGLKMYRMLVVPFVLCTLTSVPVGWWKRQARRCVLSVYAVVAAAAG
jgi:hypothetical protein